MCDDDDGRQRRKEEWTRAVGRRGGGFAWWILGPLTLMPFFMGMGLGVNWNVTAMSAAMPSLVGHLIFGAILGVTYRWLEGRHGASDMGHGEAEAT